MLTGDVPILTGNALRDIDLIRGYLLDLQGLLEEPISTGWAASASIAEERVMLSGSTLLELEEILATLIRDLLAKGVLGGP